jgi:hypothetical protein
MQRAAMEHAEDEVRTVVQQAGVVVMGWIKLRRNRKEKSRSIDQGSH